MFTLTCFYKTRIVALTSVGMVPDVDIDLDPGSGTECGPRHWLNVEPEAVLL
jgi:hypothetical protein